MAGKNVSRMTQFVSTGSGYLNPSVAVELASVVHTFAELIVDY